MTTSKLLARRNLLGGMLAIPAIVSFSSLMKVSKPLSLALLDFKPLDWTEQQPRLGIAEFTNTKMSEALGIQSGMLTLTYTETYDWEAYRRLEAACKEWLAMVRALPDTPRYNRLT